MRVFPACTAGMRLKTNTRVRRSWTHLFCIYFACGRQRPRNWAHDWRCHYTGQYRKSGISGVYLWSEHSLPHLGLHSQSMVCHCDTKSYVSQGWPVDSATNQFGLSQFGHKPIWPQTSSATNQFNHTSIQPEIGLWPNWFAAKLTGIIARRRTFDTSSKITYVLWDNSL